MKRLIEPLVDYEPSKNDVNDLKVGLNSPFWIVMKRLLKEEKEIAETAVFENEELDEHQRNQLRLRRNLIQYILELPELVIEKARPKKDHKEPDFSTYDN